MSSTVAERGDVRPTGETFTGRRMSGQSLRVPMVRLPTLELGGYTVDGHLAGVADLGDVDGPAGFAGILGPGFFEGRAVTTDPDALTLTVRPAANLRVGGYEIRLDVRCDGPSVDPFTTLVLPSGREVVVEIDTGSANLILDTRFMADCDVRIDDPGVTTKTGTDETGHHWTRHWATISGSRMILTPRWPRNYNGVVCQVDMPCDWCYLCEICSQWGQKQLVSLEGCFTSPWGRGS